MTMMSRALDEKFFNIDLFTDDHKRGSFFAKLKKSEDRVMSCPW